MSDRAARGMAYQGLLKQWGVAQSLIPFVKGTDLLGLPLKAPHAVYERVYTLPLLTISMGKGTVSYMRVLPYYYTNIILVIVEHIPFLCVFTHILVYS